MGRSFCSKKYRFLRKNDKEITKVVVVVVDGGESNRCADTFFLKSSVFFQKS
jgi:hypothetical protein